MFSFPFFLVTIQVLFTPLCYISLTLISILTYLSYALSHTFSHQETQYNDSKITKLMACLLISSFGSLAYTAFLQEHLEGSCDDLPCMPYLTKLVYMILIERLMYTMLFDNFIPRVQVTHCTLFRITVFYYLFLPYGLISISSLSLSLYLSILLSPHSLSHFINTPPLLYPHIG